MKKISCLIFLILLTIVLSSCKGYTEFTIKGELIDKELFLETLDNLELNQFDKGYSLDFNINGNLDSDMQTSFDFSASRLFFLGDNINEYQDYYSLESQALSNLYLTDLNQMVYINCYETYYYDGTNMEYQFNQLSDDDYNFVSDQYHNDISSKNFTTLFSVDPSILVMLLDENEFELRLAKNRNIYTLGLSFESSVDVISFNQLSTFLEQLGVEITFFTTNLRLQIRFEDDQIIEIKFNAYIEADIKYLSFKRHYFALELLFNVTSEVDFTLLPSLKELAQYY